jgi:thioredoxin reductase
MSHYDVAVIGGGAAGLSAALVLSRARRKVLVVDAGAPRNAPATHMHGYLSRDGIPPSELLATGRHEVKSYGGEIVAGTATDLLPDGRSGFWVLLAGGRRISARRLLVTTGLRDELPDIPGLRDRWARDVLHCPYCHGHEVRDRRLGVIGGTPGALRYAQIVRQWTHDLVYFTPPDTLTAAERTQLVARAIVVVEGTIDRLVVDDNDHLRGLHMRDGRVIPRDALFVPPRFVPNSHLLVGLGCALDADGWVAADDTGRTSVAGVWVAGNVIDPRAQVITAAGAGSAAAIALNADLVEDDVRNAVRDVKHGLQLLPTASTNPKESLMTTPIPNPTPSSRPGVTGPPTKHQLALMIWLAVFPTLTILNLVLGDWLHTLIPVVRTFVLATIAVPIVIYGLLPHLHRLRGRLLARIASS